MQFIDIQPVIMSGGAGTRLWPMSRKGRPKQFASFLGARTLFQETVARVTLGDSGVRFATPVVVCAEQHADLVREQMADMGVHGGQMILEPLARNTAPCAAAAACLIAAEGRGDALILLLPADHHIRDLPAFYRAVADGARAARQGRIVTFGAAPTAPETGYGYIRRGAPIDGGFEVAEFVEKPDRATAQSYLATGEYSWNAGIFLFAADTLIAQMGVHCPDILESAEKALAHGVKTQDATTLDRHIFGECRSESIDYALMERTQVASVTPVAMQWDDVGSWSAVWELADKADSGCALPDDAIAVDASNCLVKTDGPRVALLGVEDLVVVVDQGVVMVARRQAAQDVKKVVARVAESGASDLL